MGDGVVSVKIMTLPCLYCDDTLRFDKVRGWIHADGGGYKMRCPDCGWMAAPFPSPARCPSCNSLAVRDDHCAIPKRS